MYNIYFHLCSLFNLFHYLRLTQALGVLNLSGTQLRDFTGSFHGSVFVEFWASPCLVCDYLDPVLEQTAHLVSHDNIAIVKVQCDNTDQDRNVCHDYGATSKPTLMVFNGPHLYLPYIGRQRASSISWFMKRLESPSVIEASKENIDSIKMNGDLAVIAFVDDLDTEAESVFLSTAESFHGIHAFGISRSRDLAASEHAPYPSVMVYNRDSDSATRFPDSMTFTEQNLHQFVEAQNHPLIAEIDFDTFDRYQKSAPVLGWIFVQTEAERLHFTNSLKDLAWRYQGRITFGTVDANQFGAASARLGLTYGKWPAFAVENTLDDAVYPLDHQIVMGVLAIEAFVLSLIEDRSIPDVETAQSTADSTRQGNGRTEL